MLGAIALAEMREFPLKVEPLELPNYTDTFSRSLSQLLPLSSHNLYQLPNQENPWGELYVFFWDGKPVGLTSPSTLIYPGSQGEWPGLSWWLDKKLRSPQYLLNDVEKGLFYSWLDHLRTQLLDYRTQDNANAVNQMTQLINDFQEDLEKPFPRKDLALSDNPKFFRVPLNIGALKFLNHPIKAVPQASNVRLIPSSGLEPPKPLLIVSRDLSKACAVKAKNIWVHETTTLARLNLDKLPEQQEKWTEVILQLAEDLLLPELFYLPQDSVCPESFLVSPLIWEEKEIIPLLPYAPILLQYLTAEDLVARTNIEVFLKPRKSFIRITLKLTLSGFPPNKPSLEYLVSQDYYADKIHQITSIPILEMWPNFLTPNWQNYYVFYYNKNPLMSSFEPYFSEAQKKNVQPVYEDNYRIKIIKFDKFPTHIACQDYPNSQKRDIGLILLAKPTQKQLQHNWQVGVDFGNYFTSVYYRQQGLVKPLVIETLNLSITRTNIENPSEIIRDFFITVNLEVYANKFPSLLTNKGNFKILSNRIYFAQSRYFNPQEESIKIDLASLGKHREDAIKYLESLALYITAIAAKNQVKQIEWIFSYPTNLSLWKEIIKVLSEATGIKHNTIDLCPQNLAFAQYWSDFENIDLNHAVCINLRNTIDISIWKDYTFIYQESVELEEQDILRNFFLTNLSSMEKLFSINTEEWQLLNPDAFQTKLNFWLFENGEQWLRENKDRLHNDPDLRKLQQFITIGLAGLFYYFGIIVNKVPLEESYRLYLGGGGVSSLDWLDEREKVNQLLQIMFHCGRTGLEDVKECLDLPSLRFSQLPEQEVVYGLVLNQTTLQKPENSQNAEKIAVEYAQIWSFFNRLQASLQGLGLPKISIDMIETNKWKQVEYELGVKTKDQKIDFIAGLKTLLKIFAQSS
jgi:hypothetical protein